MSDGADRDRLINLLVKAELTQDKKDIQNVARAIMEAILKDALRALVVDLFKHINEPTRRPETAIERFIQ